MSLPPFDFHRAGSLEEAFELKSQYGDDARYLSGGTALVLFMRTQVLQPSALIALDFLANKKNITVEGGHIRIGAGVTHAEIASSMLVKAHCPLLADTCSHVATPRVRNVATIGGNLANANPHQDPPITLIALGAEVVAQSRSKVRRIATEDFFVDYYESCLGPDEIVIGIDVPLASPSARSRFIKFLPRSADDYATVNVAVSATMNGSVIADIRIAVGSMGPVPIRARAAEQILMGRAPSDEAIMEAAAVATEDAEPELDSRGSPEYKKHVAPVIVERAIRDVTRHE